MNLTLAEAQARLSDLVHNLSPGEEVAITENNRTVAKLVAASAVLPQPIAGRGKGAIMMHAYDEHLADFKDYMP